MAMTRAATEYGIVEGLRCEDPAVSVFKGIPFAAPPVGPLRWQPPHAPEPWDTPRQCFAYAPVAVQPKHPEGSFAVREFYGYQPPQSEDCLYLNLWTPAQSPEEKLPVMVYLHGGANVQGYSCKMEAGGDRLCKQGVIYVCAAYRLGVFGFLSHPELSREQGGCSGNYGLMDQLFALGWVRKNIAAFGGDPDNVTVFGQSAGGADLLALLCSPRSRGLIHRGISQSAGGLRPVMGSVALSRAEELGLAFQKRTGCESLAQLRSLGADRLLAAAMEDPGTYLNGTAFPICADGYVLPERFETALEAGRFLNIPLILGCTSEEGFLGFLDPEETASEEALALGIRETFGPLASQAAAMYAPRTPKEAARCVRQLWGDSMLLGCRGLAKQQVRTGRAPVYLYYFNRQLPDDDGTSRNGAFHSADLWYTFGNFHRSWRPMTGTDLTLARSMTGYWTNFAKTGDPNGPSLPPWPAFGENPGAMLLGAEIRMDPMTDHRVVRVFGQ